MLHNNMGSEVTPSLISNGGGLLRPPHGCHRIRYPMGGRVKVLLTFSDPHGRYIGVIEDHEDGISREIKGLCNKSYYHVGVAKKTKCF